MCPPITVIRKTSFFPTLMTIASLRNNSSEKLQSSSSPTCEWECSIPLLSSLILISRKHFITYKEFLRLSFILHLWSGDNITYLMKLLGLNESKQRLARSEGSVTTSCCCKEEQQCPTGWQWVVRLVSLGSVVPWRYALLLLCALLSWDFVSSFVKWQ